ncbi:MAG: DUF5777 family beta-barrel protein [Bernardetiaceae bacterium]|jgi:hypothetical protein|nr:DUF5777 family beta-barrel protein [Bernardetiaceae bacterium]
MKKIIFTFCLIANGLTVFFAQAQDLDKLLDESQPKTTDYTKATFKSSRVVNLHSVEKVAPGALEFRISHRFGQLNGGAYQLWGLDQATIRLGLDYGINQWLMVGVGRSTYEKTYDAFVKLNFTRQSTGARNMPVSVLYFGSVAVNTLREDILGREMDFQNRLAYVNQLIIGRKFSERFSLQASPTYVLRNSTPQGGNRADNLLALGLAGRIKLSKRVAFNAEYVHRFAPTDAVARREFDRYRNALSVGFDIETGGHVFQLHFTNAQPMIEKGFIAETTGDWGNGGVAFGFNITRNFQLGKKAGGSLKMN